MEEAKKVLNADFYNKGYHFIFTMREGATPSDATSLFDLCDLMANEATKRGYEVSWNKETNGKHVQLPMSEAPICAIHNVAMVKRPGGVSKTTGKPYNAFWACPEKTVDGGFCNYRPDMKLQKGVKQNGEPTPF